MELMINPRGQVRCLYQEIIDLTCLGPIHIVRASHVEPDEHGRWLADLSPVQGPKLGPFTLRSEALKAEIEWLNHWLAEK